jgi:hypothetical protein
LFRQYVVVGHRLRIKPYPGTVKPSSERLRIGFPTCGIEIKIIKNPKNRRNTPEIASNSPFEAKLRSKTLAAITQNHQISRFVHEQSWPNLDSEYLG